MAGGRSSSSSKKRAEAAPADAARTGPTLVRAKDGSGFARCDGCGKSVPVALISMHRCSLDAKIRRSLESQTVKKPTLAKQPPERRRSAPSESKAKESKTEEKVKKDKDSNALKRPSTAFFLSMDDFRKSYKEAHPESKGGKEVAKVGGEKWKSMTDEEKRPYQDKATELKAEYQQALESQNAEDEDDEKEAEDVEGEEAEETASEEEKKPYQDKAAELKAEHQKALENQNAENEDDEKETEDDEGEEAEETASEE